jgi:ParB family transcriptional regulator, chromosome partitioning protein
VQAAERWEFLDLFQAAVLAEFDGDEPALTQLVQVARDNPGQFDHIAARLRATRAERAAKAAFAAGLEARGYAIYGEQPYVPWTKALENLRDGDGNQITREAHATCPGRAVTISYDWDWAPGAEAAYRAAHGLCAESMTASMASRGERSSRLVLSSAPVSPVDWPLRCLVRVRNS